jgi:hypothetical protein
VLSVWFVQVSAAALADELSPAEVVSATGGGSIRFENDTALEPGELVALARPRRSGSRRLEGCPA